MVLAPKSAKSFVAVHAAIHAGAIAVPVNAMTPPAALERLVNHIGPSAAMLTADSAVRWPDGAPTLTIGEPLEGNRSIDWASIEDASPDDGEALGPANRLGSDPAYLISTSGSTGRPKSIVHTHRSGLRYAELAADCYGLRPDDRMASVAPFHFDQSTFELYASMASGASVVLISEIMLRFPASVSDLIERERVTTWYSVPTILRSLLERGALGERDLMSLRWVLFGGEVFPPAKLRSLMELLPAARFSNVYGPAEVNQCTFHHLDEPPGWDQPVPIGRPWADTQTEIVDADGALLKGAARGELLVRTATAMDGYWDRPNANERAFTHVQTAGGLRTSWYRTGDLVERDGDGVLHFLGRVDRQVKVRGVRVELEAVEMELGAIDGVTGSAAYLDDADDSLVGLIETRDAVSTRDVVARLEASLVAEAIPSRIVPLERLPRTASGKVDVNEAARMIQERTETTSKTNEGSSS
jgi:amino acid adenylation domain-containing protein